MAKYCKNCAMSYKALLSLKCEITKSKVGFEDYCDDWNPNNEYLLEENINLKLKLAKLEWVNINKRLPNHDEDIIVYGIDESGTEYMSFLEYNKENHDECYGGITHWMLIPESPPKDGDNK